MLDVTNSWEANLLALTQVELRNGLYLKREDLYSPDGYHNGSKLRQLIWLFSRYFAANGRPEGVVSGAVSQSPQLPKVASCAKHYRMKCVQFTGALKGTALAGEAFGARTKIVVPGYSPLLNARAKAYAEKHNWLHIETNIVENHKNLIAPFHRIGANQVRNIPECVETILIPCGSWASMVSVLYGLAIHRNNIKTIRLFNIGQNMKKKLTWAVERLHHIFPEWHGTRHIKFHDLTGIGFTSYEKTMDYTYEGVVMHPRYEGKIFCYLQETGKLKKFQDERTLFWIVGGVEREP